MKVAVFTFLFLLGFVSLMPSRRKLQQGKRHQRPPIGRAKFAQDEGADAEDTGADAEDAGADAADAGADAADAGADGADAADAGADAADVGADGADAADAGADAEDAGADAADAGADGADAEDAAGDPANGDAEDIAEDAEISSDIKLPQEGKDMAKLVTKKLKQLNTWLQGVVTYWDKFAEGGSGAGAGVEAGGDGAEVDAGGDVEAGGDGAEVDAGGDVE